MQKAKWKDRKGVKTKTRLSAMYRGFPKGEEAIDVMNNYVAAVQIQGDKESAITLLSGAKDGIDNILGNIDVKRNPQALKQYGELKQSIVEYLKQLQS